MEIRLAEANEFLDWLCDEFAPEGTFQTFDDDPDRKTPKLAGIFHGRLAGLAKELQRLNDKGAGVYVTVNRTDGKGRKKSNIVGIRAVYIDLDGVTELPEFALKPSGIVKTPNGFHVYWLLEPDNKMTREQCELVNKELARRYGGDPAVTDCARVLRVPGYYHRKGDPTLIEIVYLEDIHYTVEQLLALLPDIPESRTPTPAPKPTTPGRSPYGEAAREKECDAVATAPEGERNIALNKASFSLGQLVAGGEIDAGDTQASLLHAALTAGLTESEARQTMNSGFQAGSAEPRQAPRRGHLELAASDRPAAAAAPDLSDVPMPDDDDAPDNIGGGGPPGGVPSDEPWMHSLKYKRTQHGSILSRDPGNVMLIVANDAKWKGSLAFDEFSHRASWVKAPPALEGAIPPEGPLVDEHAIYCQQVFAKNWDLSVGRDDMLRALEAAAKTQTHHPVRDYLGALQWDGTKRIDTWLNDYLGAQRRDENDRIGRWWLISAVARAMNPGCQADHVLILESPQGFGKTRTVRTLAGPWYQGNLGDVRDKDGPQSLQGHWIVEIGELDAFRGANATRIKDFLTQTVDIYRPSYGRYVQERPRQCVFCGTTNDARYLKDATGGRRFWPVRCNEINIEALAEDRDQLWAEALEYFRAGERWWPQGAVERAGLTEIQEERFEGDAWEEKIATWLIGATDEVSCDEILEHLGLATERWDRGAKMRVGAIMTHLGWGKRRRRRAGVTVWRFVRPVDNEQLQF